MTELSQRSREIPPFIVMEVLEKAQEMERRGEEIIHLEIGEPDFPTPQVVCEAAHEALRRGETHYTHSLGILPLREAISAYYQEKYSVAVDPEQILVTSGTSPALFMVFSALLDPGDEIILSDPHYPCYPNFARFLGACPVFVPTHEEDGFQLRAEAIRERIGPRTKAVLINSPANPTGNLLSPERMARIAEVGPRVISDEIYHGLVYHDREHTILEYTPRAFVLNGFSKLFAMTGWRLGYVICPPEFVRPLQKIQQNVLISAGSVAQWAAIAALTKAWDEVEKMKAVYDERRRFMFQRLREMGFGLPVEPKGAFYMLANAQHLGTNSYDLAFTILREAKVGVSPGVDFGQNAEGYLRFSYANSLDNIREGLARIEAFIQARKP